jgi:hypothetical protein
MPEIEDLVEEFGGMRAFARAIDTPASTVATWKRSGIPKWRWPTIEAARAVRSQFDALPAEQ